MKERRAKILRRMISDQETQECLFLVRNGIPYDVAFSLNANMRYAWCVIFQRFDNKKFNFKTMQFEDGAG